MSMRVGYTTLWVRDQDEALAFFEKLGFQVREDVKNGEYRWLAVASGEQPDLAINLAKPGYPMDEATAQAVESSVAKGMLSTLVFTTDDCFATAAALKAKGIEFARDAQERGYGVDAAFRDPSGNEFRLLQAASRPEAGQ
ncbi:MAG: VOC family protein [Candidatus Dormibacteria bacterium]|jgi:catechol 2,3-dioxygenase-like lactoylglutathione lyase family enzyme